MNSSTEKREEQRWRWVGLLLWCLPVLVITVLVGLEPKKRSVTHHYHTAVEHWAEQKALYEGPRGMNYLPTFVPVFMPYHSVPIRVGDNLWRWTAVAGLVFGLHWYSRKSARPERTFALLSLLALPLCLAAMRNGQANAHMAAALLIASMCLLSGRWWLATLFLSLTIAIKPIGIAAVGLAFAVYPRLWWRLGLGSAAILLLPFLAGSVDYVQSQYIESFRNLRECSAPTARTFADINGILRVFNSSLGAQSSLVVRAAAGVLFAVFCFGWVRRLPGLERALAWLAFAAGYLMLFNPMNESNSYIIFASALALWVWRFFTQGQATLGWTLAVMAISMGLLPGLFRPWLGNNFAESWHPAMTVILLSIVAVAAVRETGSGQLMQRAHL